MSQPWSSVRTLLVFAMAWSLLLFGTAFFLPAVTPQNSGVQGVQPRVSLVSYFGLSGFLPAAVVLVVVVLVAWLLGFGGSAPSLRRVVFARVLAGVLLISAPVAVAFTHFVGLLALPVVVAVLVAAATTGQAASPVRQGAGWYPDPDGGGQRYWTGVAWTEHTAA